MYKTITTRFALAFLVAAMLPLGQAMAQNSAPSTTSQKKPATTQKITGGKGTNGQNGAMAYRNGARRYNRHHRHPNMTAGTRTNMPWMNGTNARGAATGTPVAKGQSGNPGKTFVTPTKGTKANAGAKKAGTAPHKAASKQSFHNASFRTTNHATRSHSHARTTTRHRK